MPWLPLIMPRCNGNNNKACGNMSRPKRRKLITTIRLVQTTKISKMSIAILPVRRFVGRSSGCSHGGRRSGRLWKYNGRIRLGTTGHRVRCPIHPRLEIWKKLPILLQPRRYVYCIIYSSIYIHVNCYTMKDFIYSLHLSYTIIATATTRITGSIHVEK